MRLRFERQKPEPLPYSSARESDTREEYKVFLVFDYDNDLREGPGIEIARLEPGRWVMPRGDRWELSWNKKFWPNSPTTDYFDTLIDAKGAIEYMIHDLIQIAVGKALPQS